MAGEFSLKQIRINRLAYSILTRVNLTFPAIDLYHFSGGVTFKLGPSDFTVGGSLAMGDFESGPRNDRQLFPDELSFEFSRISLVLGLNLPF